MAAEYLESLKNDYRIIEDLTPARETGQKTWLAFFESETDCSRVVLKELDVKRTALYEALLSMWNPYIANVLCIHKVHDVGQNLLPASVAAIEYAGDISLSQYIQRNGSISEKDSLSVCVQLCKALSGLHSAGIVHRDIKPENILLTEPTTLSVKLADFGGGKWEQRDHCPDTEHTASFADTTIVGSLGYQAPESLSERTTASSDIFSIGCVMNFMLTGADPGIRRYRGDTAVRYIISKATNKDPSLRFRNVDDLERLCLHVLRAGFVDRIPVIRSIPGYRSHTRWKAVTASCYYTLIAYELIVLLLQYPFQNFVTTAIFWFIIPLFGIGNIGYVSELLPDSIRLNNRMFFMMRAALFLVCLFIPLLFY